MGDAWILAARYSTEMIDRKIFSNAGVLLKMIHKRARATRELAGLLWSGFDWQAP